MSLLSGARLLKSLFLSYINLFTIANQTILEILCFHKSIYDYHRDKIGDNDVLIEGDNRGADIYENSFKVMSKCEKVIFKCLNELGLSSQGLAKIGSLAAGAMRDKNKWEKLL